MALDLNDFLTGKGSEAERQAFLEGLGSNADAQRAVVETAALRRLGRERLKAQLIDQLVEADAQASMIRPIQQRRTLWIGLAAAAIALLILLVGVWDRLFPPTLPELYATYYEAPSPYQNRGERLPTWEEAMEAYGQQDYPVAIEKLRVLASSDSFAYPIRAQFYLGAAYLGAERWTQAVDALDAVPSGSVFAPQAQWYAALAALAQDDRVEAKQRLIIISETEGHYQRKRAVDILARME